MRELTADLWDLHARDLTGWIVIPTNGMLRANGENVMGAGLAKQAADRFPGFAFAVGDHIALHGNTPYTWTQGRLLTIPTKSDWRLPSSLTLITDSIRLAIPMLTVFHIKVVYCPHLGCGLGQLDWNSVRNAIIPLVDDRFIFVTPLPRGNAVR